MSRLAEIIKEATRMEVISRPGSILRTERVSVIRSEALRHHDELMRILLGEGITLRPDGSDIVLVFKSEDLAPQCAALGLSTHQFMGLLAILKDLGETNPFAPATTFSSTTNTLLDTLPLDEDPSVPDPEFRPISRVA